MSSEIDPAKLKVVELRAELGTRGLDSKGNKAVLVKRLKDALEKELKKELPDSSIADTSTEDLNISQTEESSADEASQKDEKPEQSIDVKKDAKKSSEKDDKIDSTKAKEHKETKTEKVEKVKEKKDTEEPAPKKAKVQDSPKKTKINTERVKQTGESMEGKEKLKGKGSNAETEAADASDKEILDTDSNDENEENADESLEDKDTTENVEEPMETGNESEIKEKKEEASTNDVQPRGDKRKRSPSPSRSQRRRSKSPVKEDEPLIDNSKVQLNWYDSDLHLQIDKESFLSGKPYHDGAFGYIWSGVRATHGVNSGKICYEVKITEELKWEDFIRQSDRGRRDREKRESRRDRSDKKDKSSERRKTGEKQADKKDSKHKGKDAQKQSKESNKNNEKSKDKSEKSNKESSKQEDKTECPKETTEEEVKEKVKKVEEGKELKDEENAKEDVKEEEIKDQSKKEPEEETKEEEEEETKEEEEETKQETKEEEEETKPETKEEEETEQELKEEAEEVKNSEEKTQEDPKMEVDESESSEKKDEKAADETMDVDEVKDAKKTGDKGDKKESKESKHDKKSSKEVKRESKEKELPPIPSHLIRIGWSSLNSGLQLGETQFSYGYESSGKFVSDKKFSEYGKPFAVGDIVGAFLEFSEEAINIKYTLNGEELPIAISIPKDETADDNFSLFPHVLSRNYAFEVNLGGRDEPFFKNPEALSDYIYVDKLEEKIPGPTRPETRGDCEVIMMCGLPGSGKTHWVKEHVANNPDKRYTVIGNSQLLEKMTVNGNPLKSSLKGRWNVVLDKLSKCLNKLVEIAALRRRNYVIDQTNVFPSAQRRKMRPFEGFKRRAVIVVCGDEEQARRRALQEAQDGKDVPNIAVYEMKANMSLPKVGDWLEEVTYVELDEQQAKTIVQKYNKEGKDNGFGPFSQRRDYRDDRSRWHQNKRNDYRGGYRERNYGSSRFDRGSKPAVWQSRSSSWSRNERRDSRGSSSRSRDWRSNNRGSIQRHQDRGRDRSSRHDRDSYSRSRNQTSSRSQSGNWQGSGNSAWSSGGSYSSSQGNWQGQTGSGNWSQNYSSGSQGKWNYGGQGGYGQQQNYGNYTNWNYYGQYPNWSGQVESTQNWNK